MREQKRENGENIIFLFFTGKNLGARHLQAKKNLLTINEQITKIAQNHPAIIKTSFSEAPCWINR